MKIVACLATVFYIKTFVKSLRNHCLINNINGAPTVPIIISNSVANIDHYCYHRLCNRVVARATISTCLLSFSLNLRNVNRFHIISYYLKYIMR